MIKNYLLTTYRLLLRQKAYAAINIMGLTIGVTSALLILLYVMDELSYDNFHVDRDRIYRITFHGKLQDEEFHTVLTGAPLAAAFVHDSPDAESTLRITKFSTYPIKYEDKAFTERQFLVADSNFFNFFNFELISGNKNEVLKGPGKLVITESAAKKYFDYSGPGDSSPLGKIMLGGSSGERTFTISGIAQDPPANSHIQYNFILSSETQGTVENPNWLNSMCLTYVKVRPGTLQSNIDKVLDSFVAKYCATEIKQYLNLDLEEFFNQGSELGFVSQRMNDIHLRSQLLDELEANGNIQYVYLFSAIAFFILILACINFMNLSTARSANRAKEIGIRKTIGALRGRLMGQFLMESFFYTILSFVIAFALVGILLTPFNILSGKQLSLELLYQPISIVGVLLLAIIVGLLAGSYPAFYLTTFRPVEVLKGKIRAGLKSSGTRNSLVIFQFCISITLIICSIMVFNQLKLLQNQNLGFGKENILNLLHTVNLGANAEPFRNELKQYAAVKGASYANRLPPNIDWSSTFRYEGTQQNYFMAIYVMDYDHLETMGYEMVAGRYFSPDYPADTSAIVINETAARALGISDVNGKKLTTFFNSMNGREAEIIGIMKDFNFESLRTSIRPLAVLYAPQHMEMAIRITPGETLAKVEHIHAIWKKYAPNTPFEFSFLDQNFDQLYRAEQRLSQVILLFTSLAIFIACLGLLGLAAFTSEQRAKEISLRKVMGASTPQIMGLLTKDFIKLVVIAFVLAVPLSWYTMDRWLEGFAYRIGFDVSLVSLAGLAAVMVAVITISFQAIKTAFRNPVDSLRSE